MKKGFLAAAAAAVSLTIAAPAGAHTHTQLHAKLASLQRQINVLKNQTADMRGQLRCMRFVVALTSYGDESAGYLFDNNQGAGAFFTSAIDFSGSGEVPDAWVVAVDPACAPATARTQSPTSRERQHEERAAPLLRRPTHKTRGA